MKLKGAIVLSILLLIATLGIVSATEIDNHTLELNNLTL